MIHADPKDIGAVRNTEVDVGHSLGVRAGVDGVFHVVHEGVAIQVLPMDGVEEGVDGAVALAGDGDGALALATEGAGEGDGRGVVLVDLLEVPVDEAIGVVDLEILLLNSSKMASGFSS